jgi:hypothetical protein
VTTDLNTLLTALYVWIGDYLGPHRRAGRRPKLTDAELLTLALAQALLGVHSEARWLRLIPQRLPGAFPYLPVPICPHNRATTSGCAARCRCCAG